MSITHPSAPAPGMRVGPFVLDFAAMGMRRRRVAEGPAPVEIPEPSVIPEPDPLPDLTLSYLERRALLDAERQREEAEAPGFPDDISGDDLDDGPPDLPDDVADEVMGVLGDLVEHPAPVTGARARERRGPYPEAGKPGSAPARPAPTDFPADRQRMAGDLRTESRPVRASGRYPSTPTSAGTGPMDRRPSSGVKPGPDHEALRPATGASPAPRGATPDPSTRRTGTRVAAGESATMRAPVTGTPARSGSGTWPRVAPRPAEASSSRASTTAPARARPITGRHAIVRPASGTIPSRRTPPTGATTPPARTHDTAPSPGLPEWMPPARNVRDAQARVAAARDEVREAKTLAATPVARAPRQVHYELRVRASVPADRDACAKVETGYLTDSVWQLDSRQDEDEIRIGLRQISLPKPMAATQSLPVPAAGRRDGLWLVAEELEALSGGHEAGKPTAGTVVGYLTASIAPRREMIYLSAIAIAPEYRRQHLGSRLVEQMRRWAVREGVPEIIADVSAKNAPALRLLQRNGFRFCGYNDRLYPNGEVALFLALTVR